MAFDYATVDMPAIIHRVYEQMSPFQREGVGHARTYKRHIYKAKMGAGKTLEALTCGMLFKPQVWLIVVNGKNAINVWRQDIKKWFPEFGSDTLFNHVRGTAEKRRALWCKRDCLFYIVTAGSFIRDVDWLLRAGFRPSVVHLDEPHKFGLRNRKSAGYKAIRAITWKNAALKFIGMLSGTLTSKGAQQLWAYLNIMDPDVFGSYWRFIETYNNVITGPFGREIGRPKNTDGLAKAIAPYIYTVPDEVVDKYLPKMNRIPLLFTLSPEILEYYNTMCEEMYIDLPGELITTATVLGATMKLRQLIACPALIDPKLGAGDAIEAVCEKIQEDDDHPNWKHNVIFSPFVPAIPHYAKHVSDVLELRPNQVMILKGGDEPEYIQAVEERFRNDPNTMVICSLMFAQSFQLESAHNGYFPHFDWDQDINAQAEGRMRRRTSAQDRSMNMYYGSVPGSITEDMFNVLNGKVKLNDLAYKGVVELQQRLKRKLLGD